ncbi:TetR/AcrR family transcriptional regulator [Cellulosilyticum ruminicola]|uniref:TetR/AcrR family transcriptional regulator n=1 Tax=Cellulosilyticum ruminicola TaxID=425254 RepID=UPI0006D28DEE|nr:TetR/AcrR family transcriptional regulator [Cellulosilyticum ruminicola]
MNRNFLNLSKIKQENILNVAIGEFANVGYDRASTEIIASKAGISKGSLFNYFSSKQGLYEDVVDYIMAKVQKEVREVVESIDEKDFYIRLKHLLLTKYYYISNHTLEIKLLKDYTNKITENKNEKIKQYKRIEMEWLQEYLIAYLNFESIRVDLIIEDIIFVTNTLLEAVFRRYDELIHLRDKNRNIDVLEKELNKYITILKYGIYK